MSFLPSSLLTTSVRYFAKHSSLGFKKQDSMTAVRIAKILKIAQKYQVASVHPLMEQQLASDWPTSHVDWLRLRNDEEKIAEMTTAREYSIKYPRRYPLGIKLKSMDAMYAEPVAVIQLAIEYNFPSVLPAAFYCLSLIPVSRHWNHKYNMHYDSDCPLAPELELSDMITDLMRKIPHRLRSARWSDLDREAMYCLLLGKSLLSARGLDLQAEGLLSLGAHRLSPGGPCNCKSWLEDLRKVVRKTDTVMYSDPLGDLQDLATQVSNYGGCLACKSYMLKSIDDEMKILWDELPRIFSIEALLRSERIHSVYGTSRDLMHHSLCVCFRTYAYALRIAICKEYSTCVHDPSKSCMPICASSSRLTSS